MIVYCAWNAIDWHCNRWLDQHPRLHRFGSNSSKKIVESNVLWATECFRSFVVFCFCWQVHKNALWAVSWVNCFVWCSSVVLILVQPAFLPQLSHPHFAVTRLTQTICNMTALTLKFLLAERQVPPFQIKKIYQHNSWHVMRHRSYFATNNFGGNKNSEFIVQPVGTYTSSQNIETHLWKLLRKTTFMRIQFNVNRQGNEFFKRTHCTSRKRRKLKKKE